MSIDPEIIVAAITGIVGAFLGAKRGQKKTEDQLKPVNGSTETIRGEVHTISLSLVGLHSKMDSMEGKLDGLECRLNKHIKEDSGPHAVIE